MNNKMMARERDTMNQTEKRIDLKSIGQILRLLDLAEAQMVRTGCPDWVEPYYYTLLAGLDRRLAEETNQPKETPMTALHPHTYDEQATVICRPSDSEMAYAHQSVRAEYRRWYRACNLNWAGIASWSATPMRGHVEAATAASGWKRLFTAADGENVYRVVVIGQPDTVYGFSQDEVGFFYLVRGTIHNRTSDEYMDECRYMRRNCDAWLQRKRTFTFMEPTAYLGPYTNFDDAVDDAAHWQTEEDRDLDSQELATDPDQLNWALDRSVGVVS